MTESLISNILLFLLFSFLIVPGNLARQCFGDFYISWTAAFVVFLMLYLWFWKVVILFHLIITQFVMFPVCFGRVLRIINDFISSTEDNDSEHTHFPVYYFPMVKEKTNFAILSEAHRSPYNKEAQQTNFEENRFMERIRYVLCQVSLGSNFNFECIKCTHMYMWDARNALFRERRCSQKEIKLSPLKLVLKAKPYLSFSVL